MITMTLQQVADAVRGKLHADDGTRPVTGVVTDSRAGSDATLFIAVVGETHDGHDHVGAAVAGGCAAAVVSRPVAQPHVLVADTVVARILDHLGVRNDLVKRWKTPVAED